MKLAEAKLIAASPDLLEALIKMINKFKNIESSGLFGIEAIEQAEKAIEKALK